MQYIARRAERQPLNRAAVVQLRNIEDQISGGVDCAGRLVLQPIRLQIESLGALNLRGVVDLRGMQREVIRHQRPAVVDDICRRQGNGSRTGLPAVVKGFRRHAQRVLRDLRSAKRRVIRAEIDTPLAFQTPAVIKLRRAGGELAFRRDAALVFQLPCLQPQAGIGKQRALIFQHVAGDTQRPPLHRALIVQLWQGEVEIFC